MTRLAVRMMAVALAALLTFPAGQLFCLANGNSAYGDPVYTDPANASTYTDSSNEDPIYTDSTNKDHVSENPVDPDPVNADTSDMVVHEDANETPAARSSETVSVTCKHYYNGLETTIEYPNPDKIAFGTPMNFHLSGAGGSGEYGYKWGFAYLYTNGKKEMVIDGAGFKNSITTDPDFSFTFYAPGRYEFSFVLYSKEGENNGKPLYGTYMTASFELIVPDTNPDYPSLETIVGKLANECQSACTTEYEKALWCHDWLLNKCEYDYSYFFSGPEGALARGKGTCEAYHGAYTMLLDALGIQTGRMEGNGHVWTAVRIDGEWCQVDLTWDAACSARSNPTEKNQYEFHMYFGVDDAIMTAAHSDHKPHAGYESNTLKNNYFIKSGEAAQWSDAFAADINKNIAEGKTAFTLAIPASNISTAYYKYMYPVIAYHLITLNWASADGSVKLNAEYDGTSSLKFTARYPWQSDYKVSVDLPSGYAAASIWLDGVECSDIEQSGTTLSAFAQDAHAKTATMYRYNSSGVPTGMYVWKLAFENDSYTATAMPEFQDLLSYNGFAIRVVDPPGLRFKSGMSMAQKRALLGSGINGYKLTEAGSGYISNAALDKGYPFILGGTNAHLVPTLTTENGSLKSDSVWESTGGRDIFVSTLIGMPQKYYNTYYSFRSYATVTNGTESFTLYGPPVSRSIYHVASQLVTQGLVQPGTSAYAYVNGIITYVDNNLLKEA